jgi:uncharacterized membrane protein YkvA (DUF1232 family)
MEAGHRIESQYGENGMAELFSLLKLIVLMVTLFGVTFMVLLSLKESRLRGIVLKTFAWFLYSVTGLLALYIISPVDLIPDVIPVLGQMDDGVAAVSAILTGLSGLIAMTQGNKSLRQYRKHNGIYIER